jgi:hypothetical protein
MVVKYLFRGLCTLAAVLFAAALLTLPAPAMADEPKPVSQACFRSYGIRHGDVTYPDYVGKLAIHQCDWNGHAAVRIELRPKAEWPLAYSNRPCSQLGGKEFAPAGDDREITEALCVASWFEYADYLQRYSGCRDEANALVAKQLKSTPANIDRIDVSTFCTKEDVDPSITAERKKDEFVLGSFGILGWICLTVVVLCTVFGAGYSRS